MLSPSLLDSITCLWFFRWPSWVCDWSVFIWLHDYTHLAVAVHRSFVSDGCADTKLFCYSGVYVFLCQPKRDQIGPQTVWRAMLVGCSASKAILPPVSLCELENVLTATLILRCYGETVLSQTSWQDSAQSQQPSLLSRDPSSLASHPLCSKKPYPFQGFTLEVKFH